MYFEDLSPCSYNGSEPNAISIGWLDKAHSFTRGKVPDGFLKRLIEICRTPAVRHRGFHVCEFCRFENDPNFEKAKNAGALSSMVVKIQGRNGRIYQSPGMICHYITNHNYRPPDEFITAVMEMDFLTEKGAKR